MPQNEFRPLPMSFDEIDEGNQSPWSRIPQGWGHPWHKMCSYLGSFPPILAHAVLQRFSLEGDVVLDPFSGRGTTLLEARLMGRRAIAGDLNPIALLLSSAKNARIGKDELLRRVAELESEFDEPLYLPVAQVQDDDIRLIFNLKTLAELCFIRDELRASASDHDVFLAGCVLGLLHGKEQKSGSSSYASISMPNTFSMSPEYVRRFVANNQLQRTYRNVFDLLRMKAGRLSSVWDGAADKGDVYCLDARECGSDERLSGYHGQVKLILGSPPYLDIVNYAKQNWIRDWFAGDFEFGNRKTAVLDDNLSLRDWLDFMDLFLSGCKKLLSADGVIVLVIGDVARGGTSVVSLARSLLQHLFHKKMFGYIGCLSDHIQTDLKVTRIWKETKGQATSIDRVIILADSVPRKMELGQTSVDGQVLPMWPSTDRMADFARHFAGV